MNEKIVELKRQAWPVEDILKNEPTNFYMFNKNIPLFFKISDSKELMKSIKSQMKNDSDFSIEMRTQIENLQNLKKNPLWLKLEDESIIKMNLLDVYSTFLNCLKDDTYEDQLFNAAEVSFIGPIGPFRDLPLITLLNEGLLQKIIFYALIQNKIPQRDLRIHTQSRILLKYGKDMNHEETLELRQITNNGILLSSDQPDLLQDLSQSENLQLFINTDVLDQTLNNNFESEHKVSKDIFYTEEELRSFIIHEAKLVRSLGHRSGENNEFFLFVNFKDMSQSEVPHIFKKLIAKTEGHIKDLVA